MSSSRFTIGAGSVDQSRLPLRLIGFGGISAPLVGIAGAGTVLPLGAVTTVCVILAAAAFAGLAARPGRAAVAAAIA